MEQDKAPHLSLLVDPVGSTPTDGSPCTGSRSNAYTRVEQQLAHVTVLFASPPREAALSLHAQVVIVVVVIAANAATGVAAPGPPPSRRGGLLPVTLHTVQHTQKPPPPGPGGAGPATRPRRPAMPG